MTTSTPQDLTNGPDPSDRAAVEPVGIWMFRDRDDSSTVELLGSDGAVTTLVQHPDGTIEIRTAAMAAAGQAVRVAPTGSAQAFAH